MNPNIESIFSQYKASNPQPMGASSANTSSGDDWYSGVKAGTYRTASTASSQPPKPSLGEQIGNEQLAGGQKILSSIKEGASQIEKGINSQKPEDLLNIPAGIAKAGAGAVAGAGHTFFAPLAASLQKVADVTGVHPMDFLSKTELGRQVSDMAQKYPDQAGLIGDTVGAVMTFLGAKGLDMAPALKSPIGEVASDLKQGVSGVATKGKAVVGDIKNAVTQKTSSIAGGKTEAQIFATPESEVKYLKPNERKIWNDNQMKVSSDKFATEQEKLNQTHKENIRQATDAFKDDKIATAEDFRAKQDKLEQEHQARVDALKEKTKIEQTAITQKSAESEAKIHAELEAKAKSSTKQIEDLSKEVDQTAYNKAVELKPKAVKAFGEQSRTYRTLREEDMAPFKDTKLTNKEIGSTIDKTFPNSPEVATDIKSRLGLNPKGDTTIGKLDELMKSMRQDIGSAGRKGNRVYTPDEMNTDKALQGISDLLKEKGVDLSRSNNFWREWAPLRDKIVTKLRPFDTGNFETKTFSNILKNSEGDIHNKNFIKAIEETLDEPITKETKAAMQKLSDAEKSQLASKLDSEMRLAEAKAAKERALSESRESMTESIRKLEDKKIQADRALEDAKRKYTDTVSKAQTEKLRQLKDERASAESALKKAQDAEDARLNSRQLETERQANMTKKAIAKKVLKYFGYGLGTYEGAKKAVTGSF